jgi:hypothetical protein
VTARERDTVLRALEHWRDVVGKMEEWERALEERGSGCMVKPDEIDRLRGRVEKGEIT